jgi:C-terminal processing protease CtpA/Prc
MVKKYLRQNTSLSATLNGYILLLPLDIQCDEITGTTEDVCCHLRLTQFSDLPFVSVERVEPDSPASKLLQPGDILTNINEWEIGKLSQPEVAANIFRGAGNFVTLDIQR